MQRRPSVVYFRRRCCKRRSLRNWCIFLISLLLLLLCGASCLWALILSGILTLVFQFWICRLP